MLAIQVADDEYGLPAQFVPICSEALGNLGLHTCDTPIIVGFRLKFTKDHHQGRPSYDRRLTAGRHHSLDCS